MEKSRKDPNRPIWKDPNINILFFNERTSRVDMVVFSSMKVWSVFCEYCEQVIKFNSLNGSPVLRSQINSASSGT